MGREATCQCQWEQIQGNVQALLETGELILRGDLRRRIPFEKMREVRVEGQALRFSFEGDAVCLTLGKDAAAKWALAIATPPPTLAHKLGITPETTVQLLGAIDDPALTTALEQARMVSPKSGDLASDLANDLILARIDVPEDLSATLRKTSTQLAQGVPIWIIYRKGPGHPINEGIIRSTLRASGFIDTKVASISQKLTALRFNLRSA